MPTVVAAPRTLYDKVWDDHVVFVECSASYGFWS